MIYVEFVFIFVFSQRLSAAEIPHEVATVLNILEQWQKLGLITKTFMNTLLNEGVWSLYRMSIL